MTATPLRRPSRTQAALLALAAAGAALALANAAQARRAERASPPRGRILDVEGVRLHLLDRGPGDDAPAAAPVVLLHGNGATVEDFLLSGLIDALAPHRRVIAFDRPGYGHSARPRGRPWTPERQADLLAAALRRLGVEGAVVLGHSWGCLVAVAMARRHPGLVGALVLESAYLYPSFRPDVAAAGVPALPALGDLLRHTALPPLSRLLWPRLLARVFAPAPVPPRFAAFPRELALRPSQLRASAEESALMIPAAARAARAGYADLRLPLAVVAGGGDRMASPEAQSARLHRELPGSRLDVVPGAGHMVHHAAPEALLRAIQAVSPG